PATEQIDKYAISLASAPTAGTTVTVDLTLSDITPDPARVCLSSLDPRFSSNLNKPVVPSDPTTCPANTSVYKVTFTDLDWFNPVIVVLHGRNDAAPEDPHNTTITHTIDTDPLLTTDTLKYGKPSNVAAISARLDVLVL